MTAAVTGNKRAPLKDRKDDLYETPPEAVHALLSVEPLPLTIWEPACGPGSIVEVLRETGRSVIATDLIDYQCPDSAARRDFLMETKAPDGVPAIVTNPPFKLAEQFVRKARTLCPQVYMLLRLAFLESERRTDILESGDLARVHVFRKRLPMMHRDGWQGPRNASFMAFAWFVWDQKHKGPPVLSRLDWIAGD